jgi:glycosyltransferase involved in cell wall biosynthesis
VTTGQGDLLTWIEDTVGYTTRYTPEALAGAIMHLLADDALRARFGEKAKDLIRTKYNWQAIVREVEALYSDVTGRARGVASPGADTRSLTDA